MLRKDIDQFLSTLPSDVTLVAATKYVDSTTMREMFAHHITNFGENRVDSFLSKYNELKDLPIKWHFIGHLQRNKAKHVINQIDYLHSLDSLSLADLINKHRSTPLKCFIEVSINHEESKNGVLIEDLSNFFSSVIKYPNIEIVGLMMMTISSSSSEEKREQFHKLVIIKQELENKFNTRIPYLSMGMSDDYQEALKEGATHIRLGRILFSDK